MSSLGFCNNLWVPLEGFWVLLGHLASWFWGLGPETNQCVQLCDVFLIIPARPQPKKVNFEHLLALSMVILLKYWVLKLRGIILLHFGLRTFRFYYWEDHNLQMP